MALTVYIIYGQNYFMFRRILNLYRFTYSEQKSLALLCFLLVLVNSITFLSKDSPKDDYSFVQGDVNTEIRKDNKKLDNLEKPVVRESKKKPLTQKSLLDINKADSAAFLSLYGIGPVFAGRIIKYRSLLGGFHNCDQLLEVYGMDTLRYQGFRKSVFVDTIGIVRLNINTCGFKELLKHPYLDYDAVKLLVQYRDRIGPISSPSKIWKDSILPENVQAKLMPYLKSR